MIVSLYVSTTAWLEGFFRIVKACFDGVWLGVLSRERLHARPLAVGAGRARPVLCGLHARRGDWRGGRP